MIATYTLWITYETRCGAEGCAEVHTQRFALPPYNEIPRAAPPKSWHVKDSVAYCPKHIIVVRPLDLTLTAEEIRPSINWKPEKATLDPRESWSTR